MVTLARSSLGAGANCARHVCFRLEASERQRGRLLPRRTSEPADASTASAAQQPKRRRQRGCQLDTDQPQCRLKLSQRVQAARQTRCREDHKLRHRFPDALLPDRSRPDG
eukprot:scaffold136708_cov124-Phaeocystis_antarctica.AAC.1